MGRAKSSIQDYIMAGSERSLDYLQDIIPDDIEDRVPWWCKISGSHFIRSYTQVKYRDFPSPGQRFKADYEKKFEKVARSLGISFVWHGDHDRGYFPQSTKHPARWVGRNGRTLWATYNEIAYGRITQEHQKVLGLLPGDPGYTTEAATLADYQQLGHLRLVKPIDITGAISLDDRVLWQCSITREIFAESWRTLSREGYFNEGQAYKAANEESYHRLAAQHGLNFIYHENGSDIFPQSETHPARWQFPSGEILWATFSELHGTVRGSLARRLKAGLHA